MSEPFIERLRREAEAKLTRNPNDEEDLYELALGVYQEAFGPTLNHGDGIRAVVRTVTTRESALAAENERLRIFATFLFDRLDDIDTLADMVRGDRDAFYNSALNFANRRFEVATKYGHNLTFL